VEYIINSIHLIKQETGDKRMGKIIAIVNQKGGVAKTTTAINLSAFLAERGKQILLLDIDPQGNATSGIGVNRRELEHCIYDVLINEMPAEDAILASEYDRLHILPATIQLAGAEVELVNCIAREQRLKKALYAVQNMYDFIFIDCPPSLGLLTLNALTAANSILIPLQCEYYALEGVGQLMETYRLVKANLNPNLTIEGVVLTMFDARTNLSMQVIDEVKSYFGAKVFGSIIPRNVRLSEAPSHGRPITTYDIKGKGAEAYAILTDEFMEKNK
jgi:chromosome partitioning protein